MAPHARLATRMRGIFRAVALPSCRPRTTAHLPSRVRCRGQRRGRSAARPLPRAFDHPNLVVEGLLAVLAVAIRRSPSPQRCAAPSISAGPISGMSRPVAFVTGARASPPSPASGRRRLRSGAGRSPMDGRPRRLRGVARHGAEAALAPDIADLAAHDPRWSDPQRFGRLTALWTFSESARWCGRSRTGPTTRGDGAHPARTLA